MRDRTLRAAIEAIREIEFIHSLPNTYSGKQYCRECGGSSALVEWPCRTLQIIQDYSDIAKQGEHDE